MAQVIYDNNDPETRKSVAVYSYGLQVFINPFLITLLSIIVSLMLGTLNETLITMASFALLRFFTGGVHLKSETCIIVSSIVMVTLPLIHIESYSTMLSIVTLVTVVSLAPINIEAQVKIPERYFGVLKIIASIVVLLNIIFIKSDVVTLSFFVQSISLIIEYVREKVTR